jgi:hypothetical protein
MRKAARAFQPIAVIAIGFVLALASAALSQPTLAPDDLNAAALSLQGTATPVAEEVSEIGSTDGIMLMSIVIVLIVVVPILLRRRSWEHQEPVP